MKKTASVKIEMVSIDEIRPNPENPRTISEQKIKELMKSIEDLPELLQERFIVVDRYTGYIIGGNQRHKVATELGIEEVPVIYISVTDKKAREIMLKDNTQFGEWDFDKLKTFADKETLIDWGVEDAQYISFDEEDEEPEEEEPEEETEDASVIKKIVFNLKTEDYEKSLEALQKINKKHGFSDNTESILYLLNKEVKDKEVKRAKYNVYVISAGRYDSLPFTKEQKENYIFCVKNGEGDLYMQNGCKTVYETGKLIESRNFALNHAQKQNVYCVQLSDDIKKAKVNKNFGEPKEVDLDTAIEKLVEVCTERPEDLVGIPPTSNDFFAKELFVKNAFCIGDLFVCKPTNVRFDTNLTLKEDYDFTLSHVKNGGVVRFQKYLFEFAHYTNDGGAVAYRDDKEEKRNIDYLKSKWGTAIRDNKKRPNEILLKIK